MTVSSLDSKLYCAAIFIDLAKAFDTVNHKRLIDRLSNSGISDKSLSWLSNYLTDSAVCEVRTIPFSASFSH